MKYTMDEQMKRYADLVVRVGINLQAGEEVVINCEITAANFAHYVQDCAYRAGASCVTMWWTDQDSTRLKLQYETDNTLATVPAWQVAGRDYAVDNRACIINIISDNPDVFADISADKLSLMTRARMQAYRKYYDAVMGNANRWTIAAVPNLAWARKVSPQLSDDEAIDRLWELIFATVRLDTPDPIQAWAEHQARTEARAAYLNAQQFTHLLYKNSIGTDISVGLPTGYKFTGGGEPDKYGTFFTANLPTEEIFSAPDKRRIDGKVVSSMPLIHDGKAVNGFWLQLEGGVITDYGADEGYDVLRGIIETDEGSHSLGEVALVQYDSPIQNLNTMFYDTLFDENASCHFAIGKAYPSCVEGGEHQTMAELDARGINDSLMHVDFMLGTADLSVVGVRADGSQADILRNGNFVI